MKRLALLFGLLVLAANQVTASESNETASEIPEEQMTTEPAPSKESVTDLIAMTHAALKVQLPVYAPGAGNIETDLVGLPLGKAENTTDATPTPPFSNLWFNAGQSLGSAANSLSSWLNSRLGPTTTSTTTKPPEVIVRVQSHRATKQPLITIDPKRKTEEEDRIKPDAEDSNETADDDDDEEEEEEYDDHVQEVTNKRKAKPNRKRNSNKKYEDDENAEEDGNENEEEAEEEGEDEDEQPEEGEEEEDEENTGEEEEQEDEEDEEAPPQRKRKQSLRKQKRPQATNKRRGYIVDYEEDEENVYADDYEGGTNYYHITPIKTSGRQQQQQQSFLNRFRQLAQIPYPSQQTSTPSKPGYRPVRIVQNGQVVQLVQDQPNRRKVQRRRRPQNSQNSYQVVPISNNQASNQGQQQKRRRVTKPDTSNQFIIPIPQGSSPQNGQRKPQYISIPWSQLGISGSQEELAQVSQQAKPIIVNLPQYAMPQNKKRRRRPMQSPSHVVSNPQRQRLRRPTHKNQLGPVLTDQTIREIFRVPEIPPSRTPPENEMPPIKRKRPMHTSDMKPEELATPKPTAMTPPEISIEEAENDDDDKDNDGFIVVGDDDESNDEPMPRHVMPRRFLHIGGMKPYMDVLNKGRFYFTPGRQMRAAKSLDEPKDSEIISIKPAKEVQVTTDNASEVKLNTPPTNVEVQSEPTSSTESPLML